MSTLTYKPLGQDNPGSTLTTIYTVPASTKAIAQIIVANRGATDRTFRVALRALGAAIADKHYLAYDVTIRGNQSLTLVTGLGLQATDKIDVYASHADVSFNVNGLEIS